MASKHWLWRQAIDRTGKEILNVDKGHFNDKTEAVVTISASRALLSTESLVSKGYWNIRQKTYYRRQQTSQ